MSTKQKLVTFSQRRAAEEEALAERRQRLIEEAKRPGGRELYGNEATLAESLGSAQALWLFRSIAQANGLDLRKPRDFAEAQRIYNDPGAASTNAPLGEPVGRMSGRRGRCGKRRSRSRLPAAQLPSVSNQQGCPRCGRRWEVRIHFDRDCAQVHGAHFHRLCPCGHGWIERRPEAPLLDHEQ